MTDKHPITPPPELVMQWVSLACEHEGNETWIDLATQAARWGADQELDACCDWLYNTCCDNWDETQIAAELRAAMRPKPPSLAEEALAKIDAILNGPRKSTLKDELEALELSRRALERLQELESNG